MMIFTYRTRCSRGFLWGSTKLVSNAMDGAAGPAVGCTVDFGPTAPPTQLSAASTGQESTRSIVLPSNSLSVSTAPQHQKIKKKRREAAVGAIPPELAALSTDALTMRFTAATARITELKAKGADKAAVSSAVSAMLTLKVRGRCINPLYSSFERRRGHSLPHRCHEPLSRIVLLPRRTPRPQQNDFCLPRRNHPLLFLGGLFILVS